MSLTLGAKRFLHTALVTTLLCLSVFLVACQKNTNTQEEAQSQIPHNAKVGLVPFTHPTTVGSLLEGNLPANQGHISLEERQKLDRMLDTALFEKQRYVKPIPLPLSRHTTQFASSPTPAALPYWVRYGRGYGVDFLLIPQVLIWYERHGGRAGVSDSAHIRTEIFLLDMHTGHIYARSIFEEKQLSLLEDMTKVGTFFKRGGSWVTAQELAQEAITKALQELRI